MTEIMLKSVLAPYITELIAHKQALGYKYIEQSRQLQKFDHFMAEQFPLETTITHEMMEIWSAKRPYEKEGTVRNRVTPISHLTAYMQKMGIPAYEFPTDDLGKELKYTPYIFSEDELKRLFRQIDCCHYSPIVPYRHLIMPVLFRMFYCCGLRPGEPLRLKVSDVDLPSGVLIIRDSKYGNDRLAPMSEELAELCREYAKAVPLSSEGYFFSKPDGEPISTMNIFSNFRRFLYRAGISYGGKGNGPRLYDFRHTFAVHCLKRFVESGKNMNSYHQLLKTYMGHSFFKYTSYYLRMTKEMFPDIRQKLEDRYAGLIPALGGELDG